MLGNNRQQHPGRRIRTRAALLPIPQRRRWKTKLIRKLRLAHPSSICHHAVPHLGNINFRDLNRVGMKSRHPNRHVFTLSPANYFFQTLNDPFTHTRDIHDKKSQGQTELPYRRALRAALVGSLQNCAHRRLASRRGSCGAQNQTSICCLGRCQSGSSLHRRLSLGLPASLETDPRSLAGLLPSAQSLVQQGLAGRALRARAMYSFCL
jgi:hypothetical protein